MDKQKGSALIFLLVGLMVVVIAGGAFYLGRFTTPKSSPASVTTSQTPQAASATSASTNPDETASWRTYTNSKHSFSFKYPKDLLEISQDQFNPDEILFSKNPYPTETTSDKELGKIGYVIGVSIFPADNINMQDLVQQYDQFKTRQGYSRISAVIDNTSGYKMTNVAMDFPTDAVTLLKNGYEYFIHVKYYSSDPLLKTEGNQLFNQILSTFKFTQ